jgi:hypothetical protein
VKTPALTESPGPRLVAVTRISRMPPMTPASAAGSTTVVVPTAMRVTPGGNLVLVAAEKSSMTSA